MEFLNKAKSLSGDLRESAKGLKEAGLEKLKEATDAFNAARPHLAKTTSCFKSCHNLQN
jgi:hypothetical protein